MKILNIILKGILYLCLISGGLFIAVELFYSLFGFPETDTFARLLGFADYGQILRFGLIWTAVLAVDLVLLRVLGAKKK